MAVVGDIKVVMTLDDKDFSVRVENSGKLIRDLTKQIEASTTATKAFDQHTQSISNSFRGMIHTLGMYRFALYDLRDLFGATLEPIIKASAEIERMTKLMEGLSRATTQQARAQEALNGQKFVFDMAKTAPFDVKSLTDTFVKFKSAGLDPTDGSMKSLVDSVAKFGGSSDLLHRASIAIQQMAGKGVISMEELRQQLGEAIPTAMKSMATSAGMDMMSFTNLVKKGAVESTHALATMAYQMKIEHEGAALAMMQTWSGQFEKLKTQYTLFANEVGTHSGLFPALKAELENLNKWFDSDAAHNFAIKLGEALTGLVEGFASLTKFVYEHIDAIVLVGKAIAVVYGLQFANKVRVFYASLISAGVEWLAAIGTASNTRVAIEVETEAAIMAAQKKALIDKAVSNNQKIVLDKAAAMESLVILKARLAAEELAMNVASKEQMIQYNIAQQIMNGTRANYSAIELANIKAMQWAYGEQALAAERAAMSISASIIAEEAVVAGASAAMRAQTVATTAAFTAMAVETKVASTAMGTAMLTASELAGPLMWIVTILGFGYLAWQAWGNSAEESLDKAIKKTKEYATEDNLATLAKLNLANKARIESLQKDLKSGNTEEVTVTGPGEFTTVDNRKAMEAELKLLLKAQGDSYNAWAQGTNDLNARKLSKETSDYATEWANKVSKISMDTNATIALQVEALEKQYAGQKDGKQKIVDQTIIAEKALRTKAVDSEVELIKAEKTRLLRAIETATNETSKETLKSKLKANKALEDATAAEYKQIEMLGTTAGSGTKVGKSGYSALTPMEQYIEKLKEKRAELQDQTAGFLDGIAKFEQMVAGGRFTKTMTDSAGKKSIVTATLDEIREAKALLTENEKLKEAFDEQTRVEKAFNASMSAIANEAVKISEKNITAWENYNSKTKLPGNKELTSFNVMADKDLVALRAELEMRSARAQASYDKSANYNDARQILSAEEINAALESRKALLDDLRDKMIESQALDQAAAFGKKADGLYAGIADNKIERLRQQAALEIEIDQAKYDKLLENATLSIQARTQLEFQLGRDIAAINEKLARDSETPLAKLARQWKDTTTAMQNATAEWANSAADAFVEFAKTGKLNFSSLIDSILTDIIRMQTRKEFAQFLMPLMDSASAAVGNWMSGVFQFANGGIMNGGGAVELRKYATGGVANTPQLAMYGEGSMAEAYVPLPDGRSIPVTMSGGAGAGGANNVTVNVINQTSTPVSASKSQPRFDGRQMVLDIVLTAASQPGQFRDGMKGALV